MASEEPATESFEALYKRLEESLSRLESGGLTLEESLALYEEGAALAQQCQQLLKNAEQRITKLRESFADGMNTANEEPPAYDSSATEELPLE